MCDARANLLGVEMKCTAVMIVIETLIVGGNRRRWPWLCRAHPTTRSCLVARHRESMVACIARVLSSLGFLQIANGSPIHMSMPGYVALDRKI